MSTCARVIEIPSLAFSGLFDFEMERDKRHEDNGFHAEILTLLK